ncbi:MAG: tRNA 2-selenouridine(34) synthase MnmH [Bacteroidetes bacterium]|nr:tRNA 2-selenouridine(34) synthase MnmH [Bacteroidota bacterium]
MPETILINDFLIKGKKYSIVDTRSPLEFKKGNIPGSINIPIFTDKEREVVGTLYKKKGKEQATLTGIRFVSEKIDSLTTELINAAKTNNKICIYCWRGGMRSKSIEWLAAKLNIQTVRLEKGYKSYRNFVINYFNKKFDLIIIGGYTGTGKTELLQKLKKIGKQIIDIEKIANHRGSAFGGVGTKIFPTQEQFENELVFEFCKLDETKQIFIEDESKLTGRLVIPENLWKQIRSAKLFFVDLPKEVRLQKLVKGYGGFSKNELSNSFLKLKKKLGSEKTLSALQFIENDNYYEAADVALKYYDKLYNKGLQFRDQRFVTKLIFSDLKVTEDEIIKSIKIHVKETES